jgi:hypothetical protein
VDWLSGARDETRSKSGRDRQEYAWSCGSGGTWWWQSSRRRPVWAVVTWVRGAVRHRRRRLLKRSRRTWGKRCDASRVYGRIWRSHRPDCRHRCQSGGTSGQRERHRLHSWCGGNGPVDLRAHRAWGAGLGFLDHGFLGLCGLPSGLCRAIRRNLGLGSLGFTDPALPVESGPVVEHGLRAPGVLGISDLFSSSQLSWVQGFIAFRASRWSDCGRDSRLRSITRRLDWRQLRQCPGVGWRPGLQRYRMRH